MFRPMTSFYSVLDEKTAAKSVFYPIPRAVENIITFGPIWAPKFIYEFDEVEIVFVA